MKAEFFATPAEFRAWLTKHHKTAGELLVGFYKRQRQAEHHVAGVGRRGAVLRLDRRRRKQHRRRTLHDPLYAAKPRQHLERGQHQARRSELIDARADAAGGPGGLRKARRKEVGDLLRTSRRKRRSSSGLREDIPRQQGRWAFFEAQPPWYQRNVRYDVMSAKNDATRLRRLEN